MPPRKKTATAESVELANLPIAPAQSLGSAAPAGPIETVSSVVEERREREYEEILDEIGTDGRVRVWHVVDGKSVFAGDMSADAFSLPALLDAYGGGEKTLVFYQGRRKVDSSRVQLDPSIPIRNPKSERLSAQAAAPASAGPDIMSLLAPMMTMQMQNMSQSQQMMTGMVSAVVQLMTARPQSDPMDIALKMAELMKKDGGGEMKLTDMFGLFERGMNVGKSINGGNDEDGTLGLVREGLGTLGKVVEAVAASRANPARILPAGNAGPIADGSASGHGATVVLDAGAQGGRGQPQGAGASVDTGASGGGMGDGITEWPRPWVAAAKQHEQTLTLAARFMSGDTAAVELLRRMDDVQLDDLLTDMDDGTEFEARVRATFPNFNPSPEWWQAFVATIRANVEAEAAEPEATPPTDTNDNGGS